MCRHWIRKMRRAEEAAALAEARMKLADTERALEQAREERHHAEAQSTRTKADVQAIKRERAQNGLGKLLDEIFTTPHRRHP